MSDFTCMASIHYFDVENEFAYLSFAVNCKNNVSLEINWCYYGQSRQLSSKELLCVKFSAVQVVHTPCAYIYGSEPYPFPNERKAVGSP